MHESRNQPASFTDRTGPELKRVLMVDDELLILDLLQNELEPIGFHVTIASNFFDAVYYLERQQFDLLICDVMLASCNGFDVLALARKKCPGLPAIMISGFPSDDTVSKINEMEAYFFSKPLRFPDLGRFVKRLFPESSDAQPVPKIAANIR